MIVEGGGEVVESGVTAPALGGSGAGVVVVVSGGGEVVTIGLQVKLLLAATRWRAFTVRIFTMLGHCLRDLFWAVMVQVG